jgi:hypothetical protein
MEFATRESPIAATDVPAGLAIDPLPPQRASRQLRPTWIFSPCRPKF